MIAAKELRVGNKYLSAFGNIETVASIIENTDKGKITSYVNERHRLMYSHLIVPWENGNQYKPCEIEPIQLTPEILEKCGLKKLREGSMAYPELWSISYTKVLVKSKIDIESIDEGEYRWIEGNTNVALYYLHQLQNLYYSLTQSELEVNL